MKYIKTYEHLISYSIMPQVGDYVLTNDRNDIGKIESIPFGTLKIKYENEKYLKFCTIKNVIAFGKTQEEVKIKASSIKYNL